MSTKVVDFDELFKNVSIKSNNSNSFGANAIYKTIAEFQQNDDTIQFLKSDGVTLNRNKIRKYFRSLLGGAVEFKKGKYQVTTKENVLKFMKFCVNIYACFNKSNFSNFELYSVENLCKSNKEDNLQYIAKQLETIRNFIKENF